MHTSESGFLHINQCADLRRVNDESLPDSVFIRHPRLTSQMECELHQFDDEICRQMENGVLYRICEVGEGCIFVFHIASLIKEAVVSFLRLEIERGPGPQGLSADLFVVRLTTYL